MSFFFPPPNWYMCCLNMFICGILYCQHLLVYWDRNKDLYILDFENGFRIRPKFQNIKGSLSASSKPIFAIKYSFCSIFRDLQELYTFAPLRSQNFSKKRVQNLAKMKWNERSFHFILAKIDEFCCFSARFWQIFVGISRILAENYKSFPDSAKKCQKNPEKRRKFQEVVQISFVQFISSILSLITWSSSRLSSSQDLAAL